MQGKRIRRKIEVISQCVEGRLGLRLIRRPFLQESTYKHRENDGHN